MEIILPYLVALLAFFVINRDQTNRIVTVIFVIFYSISTVLHNIIIDEPRIYLINMILTTIFCMLMVVQSKTTMMMLLFYFSDVILLLIDIVAYLTYPYKDQNGVYDATYNAAFPIIIMQYAALWVNDARRINVRRHYGNIKLHINNFAMRVLYR